MGTGRRLAATVGLVSIGTLGLWALRRSDERAIASDPEQAILSAPPRGEPAAVVSSDGTRLHAEVFGEGGGSTVVLIPGWICTLRSWHYQLIELAPERRVVAYDLRGHGRSGPAATGDYSTGALAADLDAVLRALVPPGEKAVVAGHSMGAMSVVAWAGIFSEQVEVRLGGAVLVDTGIEGLIARSRVVVTAAALSRLVQPLGAWVLGLGWKAPRRPTPLVHRVVRYVALSPTASPAQVAFCERMFLDCPADVRAAFGTALSTLDLTASLSALRVPTVVIVGELDRLTPPVHARAIADALPQAKLVELKGTGHMSLMEAHADVTAHIRALADQAERSSSSGARGASRADGAGAP